MMAQILELNKVIEKASFNHLYKLLDDTNNAISLSQTTVNMKLLLDNVLGGVVTHY